MSNYELYHYGVKGMKWGIRKSDKTTRSLSSFNIAMRMGKAISKNTQAAKKLSTDITKAALSDYPSAIKFTSKGWSLQTKYRKQFKQSINAHLDSINDDLSKIVVEKDFFTKHRNDRVEDILSDGNSTMVMYMLLIAEQNNNARINRQF